MVKQSTTTKEIQDIAQQHTRPRPSLTSTLGVKGPLRVRPYGNVKHAHVVLRKVEEESYEDENGARRTRGVFSLFAHKLINVKPGKELFLYMQSTNGDLQEIPVALEADLQLSGELSDEDSRKTTPRKGSSAEEDVSLPPKMRRGRVSSFFCRPEASPAPSDIAVTPAPSNSVFVPTAVTSAGVQTSFASIDFGSQTAGHAFFDTACQTAIDARTFRSFGVQTDSFVPPRTTPVSPNSKSEPKGENLIDAIDTAAAPTYSSSATLANENSRKRSLSPMEIDSTMTTPCISPVLSPMKGTVKDPITIDLIPKLEELVDENALLNGTAVATNSLTSATEISVRPRSKSRSRSLSVMSFSSDEYEPPPATPFETPLVLNSSQKKIMIQTTVSPTYVSPDPISTVDNSASSNATERKESKPPPLQAPRFVPARFTSFSDDYNSTPSLDEPISQSSDPSNNSCHSPLTLSTPPPPLTVSVNTRPSPARSPSPIPSSSRVTLEADLTSPRPPPTPHVAEWTIRQTPVARKRGRSPVTSSASVNSSVNGPSPKRWKPVATSTVSSPMPKPFHVSVKSEPKSPVLTPPSPPYQRQSYAYDVSVNYGSAVRPSLPDSTYSEPQNHSLHLSLGFDPVALLNSINKSKSTIMPMQYNPATATDWGANETSQSFDNSQVEMPIPIPISMLPPPPPPPASESQTDNNQYSPQCIKQEMLTINLSLLQENHSFRPTDFPLPKKPSIPKAVLQQNRTNLTLLHSAQIKMKEDGIRSIVFSENGKSLAVICRDNTVRIWDNATRTEIAKLAHSAAVAGVVWLADGVASLGMNGIVSKWTQSKGNKWQWERLFDAGDSDPACLAYCKGRIAVANPRKGVKLWTLEGREWKMAERFVPRKDVITILFMNNGNSLLCGATDGSVFSCTVPEGRVKPVATFRTKIFHLDVETHSNSALITEACGRAHLVSVDFDSQKTEIGQVVQDFSFKELERKRRHVNHAFGSIFTMNGNLVVFASMSGKVFVWDRASGDAEYEMNHGGDPLVQAVASFDNGEEHQLVSGIRQGKLFWWAHPGSNR